MKKSSSTSSSSLRPTACILAAAFVFIGALSLLQLPPRTQDLIIAQADRGHGASYVTGRIQELKDAGEDFSKCTIILGDSTVQNFEQELSGGGAKFVCLYRQAFTLVDYFFMVNAVLPLKPKAIIVCVNLATFSPIYQNNPSYKFPEMISLCRPGPLESNIGTLGRFYGMTEEKVRECAMNKPGNRLYMLLMGTRKIIRDWVTENVEKRILGRRTTDEMSSAVKQIPLFLTTYSPDMGSITGDHPYFILTRAMHRMCRAEGQKLFFYITPFDVEFAKEGGALGRIEPAVEHIKGLFYASLGGEKDILYDFHDKLSGEDIVDTPGHLKRSGREKLYALLAGIPGLKDAGQAK